MCFGGDICKFYDKSGFKDYFEFGIYCSERDENFWENMNCAYLYEIDAASCEELREYESVHERYVTYLKHYMWDRSIEFVDYDEDEDGEVVDAIAYEGAGVVLFDLDSVLTYLFKLYNKKFTIEDIEAHKSDVWRGRVEMMLEMKIEKTLLTEWKKLISLCSPYEGVKRAECLGVGLKDSFYDLRSELYGHEWEKDEGFLKCKSDKQRDRYVKSYNYYKHNGLLINKEFIDDNMLIDKKDLMNWCEYVVNKTFKSLGLKYNKSKVNKFL